MSRYRASLIHLLISATVVGNVIGVIYWVWYPNPAFDAVGAFSMIRLLIVVDLVVGPLLTLIVYKQGKRGLKFDLYVIALLQIAALIYGSYILYKEKPHYLVFAVDRLEFVSKKLVDQSAIRFDELRTKQFAKLVPVFARPPEDPEDQQRYLDSVLNGQPDLEARAEFYEPWAAGTETIRLKIRPIENFRPESPHEKENLHDAIDRYGESHASLGILPIGGIEKDLGMLLDRDTLEVLGVIAIDPWTSSGE